MIELDRHDYLYLIDDETELDCARKFRSTWSDKYPQYAVEDAARLHFWNHSDFEGWDVRNFTVLLPDGTILGKFEVEMRTEPAFYATEIK